MPRTGVKVGRVDTDKAAQTQRELETGDRKYWTPAEGRNQIRIMPPPEGEDQYFYRVGFHYGIGPDNRMFPCPKLGLARKSCFLCDESDRLMKSKDEDDIADGKELRPTKRFLITVIDIDKPKDKFQVWPVGVKAFREVNYYFSDPEWGDVSDLEEGFDFIIIRKGQNLNTEYSVRVAKKPSDFYAFLEDRLGDAYDDAMWEELPILSEFLDYPADSEMEAALNGVSSAAQGESRDKRGKDTDDDDEEDAQPKRRAAKPAVEEEEAPRRGRPAFKDEEADPDEGEEEAAPPKRRAAKEETEEEEAAPRTRTSGRTGAATGSRLRSGLRR